jgi:hypothetical protein
MPQIASKLGDDEAGKVDLAMRQTVFVSERSIATEGFAKDAGAHIGNREALL